MKIIGGDARGRPIRLPGKCRIRPTADRVKKSLFDILHPVTEKSFLDLFAGSGNVGLEALSRGARFSIFVEKDLHLVKAIGVCLSQLGFSERAEVIALDARRGLEYLVQRGILFDIIFADPPYDQDSVRQTLQWLGKGNLLTENGIVVIQHSVREKLEGSRVQRLVIADHRRYGDTMLSFLHKKDQGKAS
ncbi:MAG: 16S rRNA (guanine(966)-N(2))-methyltransferase RsmD [Deltaproteobacteria bacterium]|nr:16S rRNA (guanine(966)-N(2))-methyltransferase RsmD [Deltaproteobacteria bacterium]